MTINKTMNIALTGLNAHQAALNVVSHNIANINTEGYCRQRVNFAEMRTNVTDTSVRGQIASLSGVKIASITTASNEYLNNYFRTQNSDYQGLLAAADTAGQLSDILDELSGAGLGDSLSKFFSAANALNQNPTDYSLRINFNEKTKAVASKFNYMNKNITDLKTSKIGDGSKKSAEDSAIGTDVAQMNKALAKLVDINKEISRNPEDTSLKTQRDQVLSELSGYANISTKLAENGTASVKIGMTDLVLSCEQVGTLEMEANGTISVIDQKLKKTDITADITGGSIGGTLEALKGVDEALVSLNELASAFADLLNGIQTYSDGVNDACYYDRANGKLLKVADAVAAGEDMNLFVAGDGSGIITAANIQINDNIFKNPDKIAAARLDTTVADWDDSVGNGDNAIEFYNAQNTKITGKNLKISDYIIGMSTKAGTDAATKAADADAKGALVDNISNQILSETGVNLDEELSYMIMYQQAYKASARVFATCVEIYDTLVALGS